MTDRIKDKRKAPVSTKKRVDYPRKTHKEEYAVEVTPLRTSANRDTLSERAEGNGVGTAKQRVDFPRKTYKEEYAADVAPLRTSANRETLSERTEGNGAGTANRSQADTAGAGKTVGYVGVGLGIASLFMWSIILGPLAAVMGFYAYSQGNKTSGAWAIGLGIVSTLSYFVLIPFTR